MYVFFNDEITIEYQIRPINTLIFESCEIRLLKRLYKIFTDTLPIIDSV